MHIHPLFTKSHSHPITAEMEDQATQPDIYLPLEKKKKITVVFPGERDELRMLIFPLPL